MWRCRLLILTSSQNLWVTTNLKNPVVHTTLADARLLKCFQWDLVPEESKKNKQTNKKTQKTHFSVSAKQLHCLYDQRKRREVSHPYGESSDLKFEQEIWNKVIIYFVVLYCCIVTPKAMHPVLLLTQMLINKSLENYSGFIFLTESLLAHKLRPLV